MRIPVFFICLTCYSCQQIKHQTPATSISTDSLKTLIIERCTPYFIAEDWNAVGYFLDSIQPTVAQSGDDRVRMNWVLHKVQQMKVQEKMDSVDHFMKVSWRLSTSSVLSKRDLLNFYIVYSNLLLGRNMIDSSIRIGVAAYHLSIQADSFRYAETCLELAHLYSYVEDTSSTRKYIFEAWRYRKKDPEEIPYIASTIASYYDMTGQTDSALYFLSKFDEDTTLLKISQLQQYKYENTAYFLSKKGDYQQAAQNLLLAKAINDKVHNRVSTTVFSLSEVYDSLQQYDKAQAYLDSALQIAKEENDQNMMKTGWKSKAGLYNKTHQYALAYQALDSAYVYYNHEMDTSLIIRAREFEVKYAVKEKDDAIKNLAIANEANLKIRRQQKIIIGALTTSGILAAFTGILLWRRRQSQINGREAYLRQQLLRAQIEPHFLFNMLGLLQGLIRTNDHEKSLTFLTRFSRLLRLILENFGKSFVPLRDEMAALESYLDLQAMLLENKFTYEIGVDFSINPDEIYIPPMLLQPFAENAILHGFRSSTEGQKLTIHIRAIKGALHCEIDDNGEGFTKPGQLTPNRPHATEITAERLAILGKQVRKKTRLQIVDKKLTNEGSGVRVEMDVPFTRMD